MAAPTAASASPSLPLPPVVARRRSGEHTEGEVMRRFASLDMDAKLAAIFSNTCNLSQRISNLEARMEEVSGATESRFVDVDQTFERAFQEIQALKTAAPAHGTDSAAEIIVFGLPFITKLSEDEIIQRIFAYIDVSPRRRYYQHA